MITRSIGNEHFERVCQDFKFIVDRIHDENGELDLRLRDNYFNLYYRGNSLAKVNVDRLPYTIEINKAFAMQVIDNARFGEPKVSKEYCVYKVDPKKLHAFLSKTVIDGLCRKIKTRNYGEEITFEQLLITDNQDRADFVIIDRQVQGGTLGRSRIDLLALQHTGTGKQYKFVIVEVKLGNNPELRGDVADQLQRYVEIMDRDFLEYKQCYERTYRQMKELRLLEEAIFKEVEIVKPVTGLIVVGGYPGLARQAELDLKQGHPNLNLRKISYQI